MSIYFPAWLEALPQGDRETVLLRNRYLIKTAALLHNPEGQSKVLAEALGVSPNTLAATYAEWHGNISEDLAHRIERVMGRELFPVELLRPHHK